MPITRPLQKNHLLNLPLEIRQEIYAILLPPTWLSHPIPRIGLTAVSHQPPGISLLTIHSRLTTEILDFYYTISTWKMILSHNFNLFRVDPELTNLERSTVLNRLHKVELVFYCDLLHDHDGLRPSSNDHGNRMPAEAGILEERTREMHRLANRACDVLLKANNLRVFTISWVDIMSESYSKDRMSTFARKQQSLRVPQEVYTALSPLRKLKLHPNGPLAFKIGYAIASAWGWIAKTMEDVMGEGSTDSERDGAGIAVGDGPDDADRNQASQLRVLAFDARQDRHLY